MKDRQETRPLVLTLGKLMVFAAWADGEIQPEEHELIKDLLFALPDLSEDEWSSVCIYMEYPLTDAEFDTLVEDFRKYVRTPDQRRYAMRSIRGVLEADGEATPEERQAYDALKEAIEHEVGFVERIIELLKQLLGFARNKRAKATGHMRTREKDLDDFINNPVFFALSRQAVKKSVTLSFTKTQLRRFCLAGAIMAKVAQADDRIHDDEVAMIFEVLADRMKMSDDGALLVAEVALNKHYGELDMLRICRRYFEVSNAEERTDLFCALFEIAEADGDVCGEERNSLFAIARHLKVGRSKVAELLGADEYDEYEVP